MFRGTAVFYPRRLAGLRSLTAVAGGDRASAMRHYVCGDDFVYQAISGSLQARAPLINGIDLLHRFLIPAGPHDLCVTGYSPNVDLTKGIVNLRCSLIELSSASSSKMSVNS